ncbi:MAG: signal peptidase I [Planctomycetaceae bacterium]|nr:signal peptidase I [Planctomycetaceae bacterium]
MFRGSLLRQLCDAVVVLAVSVIMFRSFQVEGYMISTGSMAPSLFGYHKRVVCPTCGILFAAGVSFDDSVPGSSHTGLGEGHGTALAQVLPAQSGHGLSKPASAGTSDEIPPVEFAADASDGPTVSAPAAVPHSPDGPLAVCPNCGQASIAIGDVIRNQGDQLLVHKNAWLLRPPRRWEVVVFRNPQKATEAYVKRVAGLPGEKIQVREGDVYADGQLCRKSLETQRAMRILVHDQRFQPQDDPQWLPRWYPEPGPASASSWQETHGGFVYSAPRQLHPLAARPAPSEEADAPASLIERTEADLSTSAPAMAPAWLDYRHWIRAGGNHSTRVHVASDIDDASLIELNLLPARYDPSTRQLECRGALPVEWYNRLVNAVDSDRAADAIERLYDDSHVGLVTDEYGYNQRSGSSSPRAVRDLMLVTEVQFYDVQTGSQPNGSPSGSFRVQMNDGRLTAEAEIRPASGEILLTLNGDREVPVRTGRLPVELSRRPFLLEMSMIDRQVHLAIDGEEVFTPWIISQTVPTGSVPRLPVRLGAVGLNLSVRNLQLYRDVHYTEGRAINAIHQPYQLGPAEYFMLGDNSPVSSDSRSWPVGAVPAELLLGKPFVVHLPSRPGRIHLGRRSLTVRIPDFSRMHYIH